MAGALQTGLMVGWGDVKDLLVRSWACSHAAMSHDHRQQIGSMLFSLFVNCDYSVVFQERAV